MTIQELIDKLTWFNLTEKLKEILKKITANQLPSFPIDGVTYGIKDGEFAEIPTPSGGDFVPLSGTESGSPITGRVEMTSVGEDNLTIDAENGIYATDVDGYNYTDLGLGYIELSKTSVENENHYNNFLVSLSGVRVEGAFAHGDIDKVVDNRFDFNEIGIKLRTKVLDEGDMSTLSETSAHTSEDGFGINTTTSDTPTGTAYLKTDNLTVDRTFQFPIKAGTIALEENTVPLKYKVYTALLLQSGTGDPVATILDNTLGEDIIWTRGGVGDYTGTTAGAFTLDKTALFITNASSQGDGYGIQYGDSNEIYISTSNATDNTIDGMLNKVTVEIRVYY